jgi:hypothetical protein
MKGFTDWASTRRRGEAVELSQDYTNISISFFLSSNGYGIFWAQ